MLYLLANSNFGGRFTRHLGGRIAHVRHPCSIDALDALSLAQVFMPIPQHRELSLSDNPFGLLQRAASAFRDMRCGCRIESRPQLSGQQISVLSTADEQ